MLSSLSKSWYWCWSWLSFIWQVILECTYVAGLALYVCYHGAHLNLWGNEVEPATLRSRQRRLQEQPLPLQLPWSWYQPWTWLTRNQPISARPYSPRINERSVFLALPAELRNLIYHEALGGRIMHIETKDIHPQRRHLLLGFKGSVRASRKRVIHTQCPRARRCRCFDWRSVYPHRGDKDLTVPADKQCQEARFRAIVARCKLLNGSHSIGLLLVCRQVYGEALPMLYGSNVFHVHDPWDFVAFSHAIRLESLSMIVHLDTEWSSEDSMASLTLLTRSGQQVDFLSNFEVWCVFWDIVAARMPGLQDLKVSWEGSLYRPCFKTAYWVSPIMRVRGLRRCEVELRHVANMKVWGKFQGLLHGEPEEAMLSIPFERDLEKHMCSSGDDFEVKKISTFP